MPQCIDPRGCDLPPERTETIYTSFRHDPDLPDNIAVGTLVWYKCESGNKILKSLTVLMVESRCDLFQMMRFLICIETGQMVSNTLI